MNKWTRTLMTAGLLSAGFAGGLSAENPPLPGGTAPTEVSAPPVAGTPMGAPSIPVAATPLAGASAMSVASANAPMRAYNYYGERYRDPFIPLLGDIRPDAGLDRPPAITSLTLKGIVQDANGRMALLVSGLNSYILRGGRLYDGRNRAVKKISGVIKTDSVVLIGADRTVRELRTRVNL